MKGLSYLLIAVLLSACAGVAKPPYVPQSSKTYSHAVTTKNYYVSPYYNEVVFSGPITVTGDSTLSHDQIRVTGPNDSFKHFSANVNNNILRIDSSDPVQVKINMPSSLHKMTSQNGAYTDVTGNYVLSQIKISGNSILRAYWIDSSNLRVIATGDSKLFLAGVVTNLDLFASGDADVDAKYLRVQNAYIKTQNDADVGVNVKNALGSISSDRSTIYYYRDGQLNQNYLRSSGSALRMVGIPSNQ